MAILQDLNIDGYLSISGVNFSQLGDIVGEPTSLGNFIYFKNGNVGIYEENPVTKLHSSVLIKWAPNNYGTGTTIGVDVNKDVLLLSSSRLVKENFLKYEKGLEEIKKINPILFNYRRQSKTVAGLLAEDLHENKFVEFVNYDSRNLAYSISYELIFVLIINSIREMKTKIEQLRNKIEAI